MTENKCGACGGTGMATRSQIRGECGGTGRAVPVWRCATALVGRVSRRASCGLFAIIASDMGGGVFADIVDAAHLDCPSNPHR